MCACVSLWHLLGLPLYSNTCSIRILAEPELSSSTALLHCHTKFERSARWHRGPIARCSVALRAAPAVVDVKLEQAAAASSPAAAAARVGQAPRRRPHPTDGRGGTVGTVGLLRRRRGGARGRREIAQDATVTWHHLQKSLEPLLEFRAQRLQQRLRSCPIRRRRCRRCRAAWQWHDVLLILIAHSHVRSSHRQLRRS
jgi:hypothetical protein